MDQSNNNPYPEGSFHWAVRELINRSWRPGHYFASNTNLLWKANVDGRTIGRPSLFYTNGELWVVNRGDGPINLLPLVAELVFQDGWFIVDHYDIRSYEK